MDDLTFPIYLDTDRHSYRSFFSDEWANRMREHGRGVGKLEEIIFDLVLAWRSAAYNVAFPAQLAEHMSAWANGYLSDSEPNTMLLKVARDLTAKLAREVPGIAANSDLQNEVSAWCIRTGAELVDAWRNNQLQSSADDVWKEYIQEHVFQITIWGGLRICYVAIYNAYDDFIARCTGVASGADEIWTGSKKFKADFVRAFGSAELHDCWERKEIHAARLARHSLSHGGGRRTERIASECPTSFTFAEADRIRITPDEVRELYAVLTAAAEAIASKAKLIPAFA